MVFAFTETDNVCTMITEKWGGILSVFRNGRYAIYDNIGEY